MPGANLRSRRVPAALLAALLGCASGPEPASPPAKAPPPAASHWRERYAHLPELGPTEEAMRRMGRRIQVDRGYLRGDWVVRGPGYLKRGAGHGETVVDGDLVIRGSGWIIGGITVIGDARVFGDDNDIRGCEVLGRVVVRGAGNQTP